MYTTCCLSVAVYMVTNMVFFLHLFVYYTYCTRHNEQLHMHKLWTDNNNNHNSSNQGGVNSRTIWRKSFQNFSIRWAVHVLAAFTLIQSLGYQIIMNNGCVKRLFLLLHDHWAWLHKYWTKKKMTFSWKRASMFKMNKKHCHWYRIHVVARMPIPDSTNMFIIHDTLHVQQQQ